MLELLWPATVLVLVYAVLGGTLARLIGLRGLWAAAAAPVFATTVIGGASVIAGWLGIGWSVLPCLAVAAVIAIGIVLVRRWVGRPVSWRRPSARWPGAGWWTLGAAVAAAVVLTIQVTMVLGQPNAISQTFDNVFHLNAIQYILDVSAASPLELGQMTSPNGGLPFYPSAWHATATIVVQLSGASIPVAVNALTLVIAAVIWPIGAMLLVRVLVGASRIAMVSAAIVSVSIPTFPLLPMDYGVLYPFQLSLAMLPFVLAATAAVLGIGSDAERLHRGWWAFVLVGSLPGLALAHPGGFVAWLALSVPMVAVFAWRTWRSHRSVRERIWLVGGLVGYAVLGLLLLRVLRPPEAARLWPVPFPKLQALSEGLQLSMYYGISAVAVALAVLIGLVWAIRERTARAIVMVASWLIGLGLFIVVTSFGGPLWDLRDALTGSWYNNWQRLASVFAIALLPLAAFGLARTVEWVERRWTAARPEANRARLVVGIAAAAIAFLVFPLPAVPRAIAYAQNVFDLDDDSVLISADEMVLLERLDETVPEGVVIAGNPYTGAGLAYAIGGREVLMPHMLVDISDDMELVNEHLDDALTDGEVCDAVDALNVGFVLDFGEREVHPDTHPLPGLEDLADAGVVELVDSEGDARLYQITACGLG